MSSKILLWLAISAGAALLVMAGFLGGVVWNPRTAEQKKGPEETKADEKKDDKGKPKAAIPVEAPALKEGEKKKRSELPEPPPPPKPVTDEVRVRQNLIPGKTYVVNSHGALSMRGRDKDWGISTTITINYGFDSEVLRTIESNDGNKVVERRTFKRVRSLKLNTALEDVRLDIGPTGTLLLGGVALLNPSALPVALSVNRFIGKDIKDPLSLVGLDQTIINSILSRDPSARMFTKLSILEGKVVRLTYDNSARDCQVEAVNGTMSDEELRFHASSVLLADSLIIPDLEVRKGEVWKVDGMNFAGLMDPTLLAQTEGDVYLRREGDELVAGKKQRCVRISIMKEKPTGDRCTLTFKQSDRKAEQIGWFRPTGGMLFSPEDQIIIESKLEGEGSFTRVSKDHLLFEARSERSPHMKLHYRCRIAEGTER